MNRIEIIIDGRCVLSGKAPRSLRRRRAHYGRRVSRRQLGQILQALGYEVLEEGPDFDSETRSDRDGPTLIVVG